MRDGSLNLDDFDDLIERPHSGIRRDAEERRLRTGLPPGALGRLDELGEWLAAAQAQVPVKPVRSPRMVLFAGDHGVAGLGVSARPAGTAHTLVRATLDGHSPAAILAREFGVPLRVVDMSVDCPAGELPAEVTRHRVRRSSGRLDTEDSLTADETEQAFRAGMAVADEEADGGTDLIVLGDLSVGGTTAAGTLIAALCGTDASVVTGRGGGGIDDLVWMRKCAAIRDGLRRARPAQGDQLRLLAAVAGADLTALTGFLLQCAVRRTPVILDGVVSAACALVAQRVAFRAPDWWLAGQSTGEPAQAKALDRMALEPLADHHVSAGEGTGALLALPLVRAAAELAAELPEVTEPDPADDTDPDATGTGTGTSDTPSALDAT
ncbi:nicotinate-nucleotide--dimethylbenzimidazole phosphoribosyltransferase [Streptomyces sp. N2-109]|uniref:Nicotinate-nucleotide--dimethylbenzimidazole phosphoribosyltransferase n=1 Tax=Streptomyces gossypii TaxID=2883101 RepID=A0ABT2JZC7_9ACTN|nr:nicotinate-nucleotide--dimethylbenzimidazole phosphoribosyltransferase [Streptomyces gossypii]MCT2593257.1 nicotinate-nucleotide--dimethylbenzimidazole phosphoribosyltransferase [Streptomyces gossypii]